MYCLLKFTDLGASSDMDLANPIHSKAICSYYHNLNEQGLTNHKNQVL